LGTVTDPETVKGGTKITGAASGGTIDSLTPGASYSVLITANITAGDGAYSVDSTVSRISLAASGTVKNKTISSVALNFRYVPGGSFQYRSGAANVATITSGYWLGETEVTQELFEAVMGTNPSEFDGSTGKEPEGGETQNQRPVEKVSWYAAIAFCNKLSLLDGKDPAYSVAGVDNWTTVTIPTANATAWNAAVLDLTKNGYRLPSYLEWFWAAMGADKTSQPNTTGYGKAFAGSTGSNSIGDYAWYSANAGSKTHEVAQKSPNELNLYDMSGNVGEWCQDYYNNSSFIGALTDYMCYTAPSQRAQGGGNYTSSTLTLPARTTASNNATNNYLGLRVLCPQEP
jgi:formylglycine-generating enzyme required for sulfatase activity